MLNNIRSKYIIRIIFDHFKAKYKYKIVKYNKILQDKLELSLKDYKRFTRTFIIYETESRDKGKEYMSYDRQLVYEGGFLNGERNGKGKEYENNKVRFDGEYLKGKRKKGKEYDIDGNLLYRGHYLNGKKWNGHVINTKSKKIYAIRDGKGFVMEFEYFGYFEYVGEYINGERNGNAKSYSFYFDVGVDESLYLNKKVNNYESLRVLRFEGEYKNGFRKKGKEYDLSGILHFEGEYCYMGIKKGKFYIKGKLEFKGEFLNDKKWNGIGYDENGNIIYRIKNGNGKVKEYDNKDNLKFEGEYLNGKKNGKGKE